MTKEYAVIYLGTGTDEAEEVVNAMAGAGWEVVCSCATNRLVLTREVVVETNGLSWDEDAHKVSESTKVQTVDYYLDLLDDCDNGEDEENVHKRADLILCKLLTFLGYEEVVEKYKQLIKLYY